MQIYLVHEMEQTKEQLQLRILDMDNSPNNYQY